MTELTLIQNRAFRAIPRHHPIREGQMIFVASDEELRKPSHRKRLALWYGNTQVSRRRMPDYACDILYGHLNAGGEYRFYDGTAFVIDVDDIDTAMHTENDLDAKWFTDFLAIPATGVRYRLPRKRIPLMRLLDLIVRTGDPEAADKIRW